MSATAFDFAPATAPTRQPHVVKNPFHLWAHQTYANAASGNHARTSGGNEHFQGLSAYSYSTEMARIVTNARGERAYVLNAGRYSVTTARHQSNIRMAIPAGERIFRVSGLRRGSSVLDIVIDHPERVVTYYVDEAAEAMRKASRARKCADSYTRDAMDRLRDARDWAAFWDLDASLIPVNPQDAEAAAVRVRASESEAEKAREAARLVAKTDALRAWMDHVPGARAPYGLSFAYMRLSMGGATVQTTQGAEVPADAVRKAAPLILRALQSGCDVACFPKTVRFGHYTLSHIKDGVVTVGCHRFERAEIERFAKVLGIE